jgi:hypothetical protein
MTVTPELVAEVLGILAIIGTVLPHLQALLQKRTWSPRTKAILSVVWALVAGFVAHALTVGFPSSWNDLAAVSAWAVGAFTAVVVAYRGLWRNVGSTDALENKLVKDDGPYDDDLPPEHQLGGDGGSTAVG